MRIIVIGAGELVPALAAQLGLPHFERVLLSIPDDFVLDGTELRLAGVRTLDAPPQVPCCRG